MAKDMINGEIREYNGKKYRYKEIEAMESDIGFGYECCEGCSLHSECSKKYGQDIVDILGHCYEGSRQDGRNGIFEEVESE